MTFDEIKLRLEQVLNDNFGDIMRFTDAQVQWAINQGIKRLIDYAYQSPYKDEILNNLLIVEENRGVVNGTVTPANTPYVVLGIRGDKFPLKRITAGDVPTVRTDTILGGLDPYYVFDGNQIRVYNFSESNVYVTYIKVPTYFDGTNGSSSPEFPEKFHDFLIWYPAHLLASNVESGFENYAEAFLLKAMEIIGVSLQASK